MSIRSFVRAATAAGVLLVAGSAPAFSSSTSFLSVNTAALGPQRPVVYAGTDAAGFVFVSHRWNPPGAATSYFKDPFSIERVGNSWAIRNLAGGGIDPVNGFNLVGFPKGDPNVLLVTANATNSKGDTVTIDDPRINGNPRAGLIIQNQSTTQVKNTNRTGVRYDGTEKKWRIVNENTAAMPVGAQFFVLITTGGSTVVVPAGHNTNYISIPNLPPKLNANATAKLLVTHNLSPNGMPTAPFDHNLGVWYGGAANGGWIVYAESMQKLPAGLAINVDWNFFDAQ